MVISPPDNWQETGRAKGDKYDKIIEIIIAHNALVAGDWQGSVLDRLATPPAHVDGERYLIIATATGDWVGREDDIAESDGSSWSYVTPTEGSKVWVEDENAIYMFITSWIIWEDQSVATSSTPTFAALILTAALVEAYGGTNQTTYAQGDLLYASAVNTLAKLAKGTNLDFLQIGATIPAWATPGPTNQHTGLITYAQGDLLYASAVDVLARLAKGTSGKFLQIGATIPSWVDNPNTDIAWNATTVSQAEAEAGSATTDRKWTAERVKQAIEALGALWNSDNSPAVTRYYSISPVVIGASLQDDAQGSHKWEFDEGFNKAKTNEVGQSDFGINLPDGAIVTGFYAYTQHLTAASSSIKLHRHLHAGGTLALMAEITPTTTAGERSDESISSATIDNSLYSYCVELVSNNTNFWDIFSIWIRYTVVRPQP